MVLIMLQPDLAGHRVHLIFFGWLYGQALLAAALSSRVQGQSHFPFSTDFWERVPLLLHRALLQAVLVEVIL